MEAILIQTATLLVLESKHPHPLNHPQAQDGCIFLFVCLFFVDPLGLSLVLLVFLLLTKMLINEMTVISFLGVL